MFMLTLMEGNTNDGPSWMFGEENDFLNVEIAKKCLSFASALNVYHKTERIFNLCINSYADP